MGVIYEMMRQYDLDTPFGFCADPTDPDDLAARVLPREVLEADAAPRGAVAYELNPHLKEAF
jgi:hypothetical protein